MGGRRLRRFILGVNSCWLRSGMERNLDRHCGGSDRSPSRSNCLFSALWNLESGNPNLRGLSEFLYLYRFQVKPLQARPQATLRRNSCPDYPAAPRISRRFCGLHYVREQNNMVQMIIAAVVGYFFGSLLRTTAFSDRGGAGWGVSLGIAIASWLVAVLGLTIFAQTQLGATGQPVWVGSTSLFFAGGLFYGVKRKAQK